MSESNAAPASEPSAPAEPAEDPSEVIRFLTHLSPTYAEPAKTLVAGGVETVADLAGLDYQDLSKYDISREIRDKLGRVVSEAEGVKG